MASSGNAYEAGKAVLLNRFTTAGTIEDVFLELVNHARFRAAFVHQDREFMEAVYQFGARHGYTREAFLSKPLVLEREAAAAPDDPDGYTFNRPPRANGINGHATIGEAAEAERIVIPPKPTGPPPLDIVKFESLKRRGVQWLWEGYIPAGSIIGLTGEVGTGKSLVIVDWAASTTNRKPWPDGKRAADPQNFVLMTAEDDLETVVLPRLEAAGADLKRCRAIPLVTSDKNNKRPIVLAKDIARLEATINDIGNVGMVAIEPILGFLGSTKDTNTHVAADIRQVLGQLADLAHRRRFTVILGSNTPKGTRNALDSFMASAAQVRQMRGGYITVKEYDDDKRETDRIFFRRARPLTVGGNPPGLVYRILGNVVGPCAETGLDVSAGCLQWEGIVEGTADEALRAAHFDPKTRGTDDTLETRKELEKAKDVIMRQLGSGMPVDSDDIKAHAGAELIKPGTLRRAKEDLGIVVRQRPAREGERSKDGKLRPRWEWLLPEGAKRGTTTGD
jgi:putative DNA primase/helicase